MVTHFHGFYNKKTMTLPDDELSKHSNSVKFKEFDNMQVFIFAMNILSLFLFVLTGGYFIYRAGISNISPTGVMLVIASVLPHEFIHASFFRTDTHVYLNTLAAFVASSEPVSKNRYLALCLTPSIVFGIIPFTMFCLNPSWLILGTLGATSIPVGIGDYYNAWNCIVQVPKDGLVFMHEHNTYWYVPEKNEKLDAQPYPLFWGKGQVSDRIALLSMYLAPMTILLCGIVNKECVFLVCLSTIIYVSIWCLFWYAKTNQRIKMLENYQTHLETQ